MCTIRDEIDQALTGDAGVAEYDLSRIALSVLVQTKEPIVKLPGARADRESLVGLRNKGPQLQTEFPC